jgi:prepilin-type N-terminal cleavage/methylation domain-containing protein
VEFNSIVYNKCKGNYMKKNNSGFTLLEVLLVVAIIAILAGIVIFAINPTKQLADSRNTQRRADVNTILNAVYQYAIDTKGVIPASITTSTTSICRSDVATSTCTGLVDLTSYLTLNETYLTGIPRDPSATSATSTGYSISKSVNGRVTVSAPSAEQSQTISATR